jgi:hypothetical protein
MVSAEFDTMLYLFAPDGSLHSSNDDEAYSENSQIEFTVPSSGLWTIQATTFSPRTSGNYHLSIVAASCPMPDATITAPGSVCPGVESTASVPSSAAAYSWHIEQGVITSSPSAREITFLATGSTAPTYLTVFVTSSSCGEIASRRVAIVVVKPPTATVRSNNSQYQPGSPDVEIRANLTGDGPWDLKWSPGNIPQHVNASPARFPVHPDVTTRYTISEVRDALGCLGTTSGEAIVTVAPVAPTQFVATAISNSAVSMGWSFAGSDVDFAVDRCSSACSSSSSWAQISTTGQRVFLNQGLAEGTSYLYRVRARRDGTSSAPSAVDVATTVIFSNNVVAGAAIDDAPVVQLRTAIHAMSVLAGMSSPQYTGANLANAVVLAVHLGELRTALGTARANLGLPAVSYSASSPSIRAVDVTELRGGVQ